MAMDARELIILAAVATVFIKVCFVIMDLSWFNLKKLLQMLLTAKPHVRKVSGKTFSFLDIFEEKVDASPNHVQFVVCETGQTFTLAEMDKLANQVGHWAVAQGLKQHNAIAIMMLNHPDFVSFALGFGKAGVGSAWINTNITGKALVHSCELALKDTEKKILIVDSDLRGKVQSDMERLEAAGIEVVYWGTGNDSINHAVKKQPSTRLGKKARCDIKSSSPYSYIFTSGTTGLPKACKITQGRYLGSMYLYSTLCDLSDSDRIYCVLPLYHSAAGLVCVSAALRSGACVVLRKKFSASNFTADCLKYKVTSFQYIGELCRYLLANPPNPNDSAVALKTAFGNGLRPEIWEEFRARFSIGRMVEFYAATEGNVVLFNGSGKVGALGYIPPLLDPMYPALLIRTEPDDPTVPLRDAATGMCIRCKPGEVGLLVMPVGKKGGDRQFEGYTDAKATASKLLSNVLRRGDQCFNTGDLLTRDRQGFYYWSDRVGDTFRWKGENCATTEVATIIAECNGVHDNTVYGVEVPGCDGRAGMAVIVLTPSAADSALAASTTNSKSAGSVSDIAATILAANGSTSTAQFSFSNLLDQCKQHLPVYAWPLFIRIKLKGALKTTSTFKHVKTDLVKEGFDPSKVGDDVLFFYDGKAKEYKALDADAYSKISSRTIKF